MIVDASVNITTIRLTATRYASGIRIIDRVRPKEPERSLVIAHGPEVDLLNVGKPGHVDCWERVEEVDEVIGGRSIERSVSLRSDGPLVGTEKATRPLAISSNLVEGHDGWWGR